MPRVQIPDYSDEHCALLQQQHQELLQYASAENQGREVAFVFRPGLTERQVFQGSEDELDFGGALYGTDLIVMHNHPRNSSFSSQDIAFILGHDEVYCLTIVKNDGGVEILIKTDTYDRRRAITELNRYYKRYAPTRSDEEITRAIYEFLKGGTGGLEWIKTDGN